MMTYAASTRMAAPVASPSSPSVRFTALEAPATMATTRTTKKMGPIEMPKSARNDRCVEAGVRSYPSGKCRASTANTAPTTTCPVSLAPLRRPRLRCLYSLMKSSANPTAPKPVIRNKTSRPDTETDSPVARCPAKYPTSVAMIMTVPPIVGVPRLLAWPAGPSSRMGWP